MSGGFGTGLPMSSFGVAGPVSSSFAVHTGFAPAPMPRFLKPDPKQPDTLGWRQWVWNAQEECLQSPSQGTLWPSAELAAVHWADEDAVRGVAGIHALLVPRHWKLLNEIGLGPFGSPGDNSVVGIVERFGRYVLGTEGWRAEQVVIRELAAPSTEIGLKLEQKYPDVIVHYPDQIEEGETPCRSEKSFALEKGSRSALPSLPRALSQPSPQSYQPPPPSPSPQPPSVSAKKSPPDEEIPPLNPTFPPLLAGILVATPTLALLIARLFV